MPFGGCFGCFWCGLAGPTYVLGSSMIVGRRVNPVGIVGGIRTWSAILT